MYLFSGNNQIVKILRNTFDIKISVSPGYKSLLIGMLLMIWFRILYRITIYLSNCLLAIYLFIIERDRIKKILLLNKIKFTLTWPIFDIIGRYTIYVALFKNVTWKPIPHESKVTIDDIGDNK
jgi:hypothetical protein